MIWDANSREPFNLNAIPASQIVHYASTKYRLISSLSVRSPTVRDWSASRTAGTQSPWIAFGEIFAPSSRSRVYSAHLDRSKLLTGPSWYFHSVFEIVRWADTIRRATFHLLVQKRHSWSHSKAMRDVCKSSALLRSAMKTRIRQYLLMLAHWDKPINS